MKQRYDRPLTPEALAQLPDDQIDTTDSAELDADFWASANVTPPRIKPNVSLRTPSWLGDGWPTYGFVANNVCIAFKLLLARSFPAGKTER